MSRLIPKKQFGGKQDQDKQYQYEQYQTWLNLPAKEKTQRNINIAKAYIQNSPNIRNLFNAGKALLGRFNPSNPYIIGGTAPNVSVEGNIEKEFELIKKAQQEVQKGKDLYTKFINSPEYLQRIKDGHRVDQIKEFYDFAKRNRPRSVEPIQKEYAKFFGKEEPTVESLVKEFNERHALALENSRKEHLINKEYDEILNKIKLANDDKNSIIYQDVIRFKDKNGIEHILPNHAGIYRDNVDQMHISTYAESPINTYIHENSHRIYKKVGNSSFKTGLNDNNIKTKSYFNLTNKDKKYYESFDEARSRTLNALSQMYDKGYHLSYKGFKDWTRKTPAPEHINELNFYDNNTIKHLINLMYLKGGRLIPKAQLGLKEQRIQANQQHKDLANQNWKQGNILKAVYHWYKGTPGLGGQFENDYIYQTGVAPNPAMKPIGVSKTIKDGINSATKLENGAMYRIKGLTKKGLLDNPQLMEARKFSHFEKPFNKQAYTIMETDDPSKIKAGLEKIQQLYDQFKRGLLK